MQNRVLEYAQLRLVIEDLIPKTVENWHNTVLITSSLFPQEIMQKFRDLDGQMKNPSLEHQDKAFHLEQVIKFLVKTYEMDKSKEFVEKKEDVKLLASMCIQYTEEPAVLKRKLEQLKKHEVEKIVNVGKCDLSNLIKDLHSLIQNAYNLKNDRESFTLEGMRLHVIAAMLVLLELINLSMVQEEIFMMIFHVLKWSESNPSPKIVIAKNINSFKQAQKHHKELIALAWFTRREMNEKHFLQYQNRGLDNIKAVMLMCLKNLEKLTLDEQHHAALNGTFALQNSGIDMRHVLNLKPNGIEEWTILIQSLKKEAIKDKTDFRALVNAYIAAIDWLYQRFILVRTNGTQLETTVVRSILEACLYSLTIYLEALVNYQQRQRKIKVTSATSYQNTTGNLVQPIEGIQTTALDTQIRDMEISPTPVRRVVFSEPEVQEEKPTFVSTVRNSILFGQGNGASTEDNILEKRTVPTVALNLIFQRYIQESKRKKQQK
ncbi:hypothetical protein Ciccas_000780 [Cichlidogyrus casuarinus]|uniref:Uncharacterized protein n=1 Tax=Cichlidogyrus casuarinus TaxID=1844966 RepID=A0ABD2QM88_9PLAT